MAFIATKPFSVYRPYRFFNTKTLLDELLSKHKKLTRLMRKYYDIDLKSVASVYELPLYKEYLSRFDTEDIDIELPITLDREDFDLLFKLIFASFSSSWHFELIENSHRVRLVIYVQAEDKSTEKYLDELSFFQIRRMYEIYLNEQFGLETLRFESPYEKATVTNQRQQALQYFQRQKEAYEAYWMKTLLSDPNYQHITQERSQTMSNSFLFAQRIWLRLNDKDRQEVLARFYLSTDGDTKDLSLFFSDGVIPKAFIIAANAKADMPFDAELIINSPRKQGWDERITYDEDGFGVVRRLRRAKILTKTPHLRKNDALRVEQLLQSSLRLKKEEKIAWLNALKHGEPFQALWNMLEEEMRLYEVYFFDEESKKHIQNRIKETRKAWREIVRAFKDNLMPNDGPQAIFQAVTRTVIGQDEAAKRIATLLFLQKRLAEAYRNGKKTPFQKVDSVLLSGQTGTGKSLLLQKACESASLPFVFVNAAGMVSNGIRGYSIDTMFKNIIRHCEFDMEKAETAVVMLDEIDKLLYHHDGRSILSQLLRVIEGGEYTLEKHNETERELQNIHTIKTDHMLFFFAGSFQFHLDEQARRSGFIKPETQMRQDYDKVIEESGLPKELLGRISDIIVLNPLDKTMLKRILLESDASPLKTFKRFFEAAGCTLTIDDTFIDEVVEEAIASPFGARALQRILHRKLMPKLFEKTQRQHTTYADALAMIGTRALK